MGSERAEYPPSNFRLASILAIGTAVPPTVVEQSTFPDVYFNVTGSNHLFELKNKFKRICNVYLNFKATIRFITISR